MRVEIIRRFFFTNILLIAYRINTIVSTRRNSAVKERSEKKILELEILNYIHPHVCNLFDNDRLLTMNYIFVMPSRAADTSFPAVVTSETRVPFLSGTVFHYCNARRSSLSLCALGYTNHLYT